jgi:type I restriction enzyme S subunit
MIKWEEIKFKDFITLQRGYDLFRNEYQEGEYPVVGATEIAGYHNSFKVIGPGITVGRVGSIGNVQLIQKNYWPHQDCLYVKDFKGNDLKFVFYCLKALPLSHLDAGGAVPALNRNHLDHIRINLPPLTTQKRIASILSAYDELIEVNNQRIKILEETARELYKEWFVRMRFPGHKQAKFVKGIPEGWKVKKFGEVVELVYGKALKEEDRKEGQYLVYGSSGIVGTHTSFIASAPGIVVGRKGNVGSVFWVTKDFYPIDTAFYVKTAMSLYYTYFNLQNQHFIEADAAVPGLSRNQAYSNFILIPSDDLLKSFDAIIKPIFEMISTLEDQNDKLRQIRDRLLPRLISGKLEVKTEKVLLNSETETKYN